MPRANPELDVSYLGSLYKIVVSFNTLSFYYYHYVNELARPTGRDFALPVYSSISVTIKFCRLFRGAAGSPAREALLAIRRLTDQTAELQLFQ